VLSLADRGVLEAVRHDPGLRLGVNVAGGVPTHPAVARSVGEECVDVESALAAAAYSRSKSHQREEPDAHA
jgi:alanine dehydrogenase